VSVLVFNGLFIFHQNLAIFLILKDNYEIPHFLQTVEEKIARHDSNNTVSTRYYFFLLDFAILPSVIIGLVFCPGSCLLEIAVEFPSSFKRKRIIISPFRRWWFKLFELLCIPSFILGICIR